MIRESSVGRFITAPSSGDRLSLYHEGADHAPENFGTTPRPFAPRTVVPTSLRSGQNPNCENTGHSSVFALEPPGVQCVLHFYTAAGRAISAPGGTSWPPVECMIPHARSW